MASNKPLPLWLVLTFYVFYADIDGQNRYLRTINSHVNIFIEIIFVMKNNIWAK
jgi:hypothetical protein